MKIVMHPLARTALAVLALVLASPALADDASAVATVVPVKVQLPDGVHAASIETTRADSESKYVSIDSLTVHNPSRYFAQGYKPEQFRLIAGARTYTPVVRPKLDALDLSQAGVLPAGETLHVTVTFKVPNAATAAKFEFIPHWQSDGGGMVDYCCSSP